MHVNKWLEVLLQLSMICKKLTVFYNMMFHTRLCDIIIDPLPLMTFVKHMQSLNCHMLENVLTVSELCPIPKCIAVNIEKRKSHDESLLMPSLTYVLYYDMGISCIHQLSS